MLVMSHAVVKPELLNGIAEAGADIRLHCIRAGSLVGDHETSMYQLHAPPISPEEVFGSRHSLKS